MLRNLDTIYYKPDLVKISQPKLISARTFFWFTEVDNNDNKATQGREGKDNEYHVSGWLARGGRRLVAFVGGCARSCRIDHDSKINQLDDM
jgi:hypothetical protein